MEVFVQGSDLVQRQYYPESGISKVGILLSEEVTLQCGGRMWSLVSASGDLVVVPWGIIQINLDTLIMKLLEVYGGQVQDILKGRGEA